MEKLTMETRIVIALVIAAIVLRLLMGNPLKNSIEKISDAFKPEVKELDPKQKDWLKDQLEVTNPKTISNETAKRYAEILKNAMTNRFFGLGWGTDEQAVYDVLNSLNNKADFYAVFGEFGNVEGKHLIQWLQSDEFKVEERYKINAILNKIDLSIIVN